jgi:luciferase family oxidoreductase group 1
MVPLSVLDLSPVVAGVSGAVSLRNSLDLATLADRLGYTRYWVAEHHNLPSIASSAPEIMIGQIAAATVRMRVGAGGVMLSNHAPLMVAERFKVLEALFPGRIDLGLGRAPGTDPVTSYALRRHQSTGQDDGEDDFLQRFQELLLFESRGFPPGHPFQAVHAMPKDVALPPIWLLGSSGYSAQLAAMVGAGYSFAHHFADHDPVDAMLSYRNQFKPSQARTTPYAILACAAVCRQRCRGGTACPTISDSPVRRAREYPPSRVPRMRKTILIRPPNANTPASIVRGCSSVRRQRVATARAADRGDQGR